MLLASAPPALFPELALKLVLFSAPLNCRTDRPGQEPEKGLEGRRKGPMGYSGHPPNCLKKNEPP
ncbi:hypothetical protein E2C01_060957 [Portunus trituberculatus]|uniref:Uncharacterized protein n=1 Tax=Portunus trituberculatus TaxID=210409 RepID=A0A5B7HDR9_PORTR|nr:hypothetical protein [Portunus trituberculatus]